jgi:hypothetical protein
MTGQSTAEEFPQFVYLRATCCTESLAMHGLPTTITSRLADQARAVGWRQQDDDTWLCDQHTPAETHTALDPRARARAHAAVRAHLAALGAWMPATITQRDTAVWSAVHDALDAASLPRQAASRHDSGPSVREAAADDRRWPLEKAGE